MKKKEREIVFNKFRGRCSYCGCELQKGWHVDHIEPIVRDWWKGTVQHPERETESNYNPSCASCNMMKGSLCLEGFREVITRFVSSLNLYSTQYKFAKKYGLVTETNAIVKFYFETLINKNNEP